MATSRGNLAYDISVYEPKAKPSAEQQEKPRISVKKNNAVRTQSASGFFITAITVVALAFAMLHGKVEINRLFGEITDLEDELKTIQSENLALAAEYESMTSLKNVEDYAQNVLGLKKLDKSQIQYIELPGNNVIEVVEEEKKNIFVIIRNWLSGIGEYFGA